MSDPTRHGTADAVMTTAEDPLSWSWDTGSAPPPTIDRQRGTEDIGVRNFNELSVTSSSGLSINDKIEGSSRKYQGKYNLPTDEQEIKRLDLQHALFNITLGEKLYLAPISPTPNHVLDIATDFAKLFPSAQVLGTDLNATQPLEVPANCRFTIKDAEEEWNFTEKFDYIHGRALLVCFKDPKHVIKEAFKSLAPGGYLELQDMVYPFQYAGEPPVNCNFYKWHQMCMEGSTKMGRSWTNVKNYKRWLEEVGFEDVVEKSFYWPTNPWPEGEYYKQIGTIFQASLTNGIEGMSLRVMSQLGWSVDEIRTFLVEAKNDIKDPSIACYLPGKIVYGRKPM